MKLTQVYVFFLMMMKNMIFNYIYKCILLYVFVFEIVRGVEGIVYFCWFLLFFQ